MADSGEYLKSLTAAYTAKLNSGAPKTTKSVTKKKATGNSLVVPDGIAIPTNDPNSFANRVEGAVGPKSTLGKIIDVLSRPAYGIGNMLKEDVEAAKDISQGTKNSNMSKAVARGDNPLNVLFNATSGAFNSGISGRSKNMADSTLSSWEPRSGPEGIAKFAVGLGLDIATDPLTYLGPGAVLGVAKKIPFIAKGLEAMKSSGNIAKDALKVVPKAVGTTDEIANGEIIAQAIRNSADKLGPMSHAESKLANATKFAHSFPTAPKEVVQSVQDAASKVRFTAGGKVAYDFKSLPSFPYKTAKTPAQLEKDLEDKLVRELAGRGPGSNFAITTSSVEKEQKAVNLVELRYAVGKAERKDTIYQMASDLGRDSRLSPEQYLLTHHHATLTGRKAVPATPALPTKGTHAPEMTPEYKSKLNELYKYFDIPLFRLKTPDADVKNSVLRILADVSKEKGVSAEDLLAAKYGTKIPTDRVLEQELLADIAKERISGPAYVTKKWVNVADLPSKAERIQVAAHTKVIEHLRSTLTPEDFHNLTRMRSEAGWNEQSAKILRRQAAVIEYSSFADSPAESVLRKITENVVTPRTLDPTVPLRPATGIVDQALGEAARLQFRPGGTFTERSAKGTLRNEHALHEGKGVSDAGFNARAQSKMFAIIAKKISKDASKVLDSNGKPISGEVRAGYMREHILPLMTEAETVARSRGLEPILGEANKGHALGLGDILHALDRTAAGKRVLANNVFDLKSRSGNVFPSSLMEASNILIESMRTAGVRSVDDIPEFIKTLSKVDEVTGRSIADDIGWSLVHEARGAHATVVNGDVVKGVGRYRATFPIVNPNTGARAKVMVRDNLGGKDLATTQKMLAAALTSKGTLEELVRRNVANSARYEGQLGYEVQAIVESVTNTFLNTWKDTKTSTGEAIVAFQAIEEAKKLSSVGAMAESRAAAGDLIDLAVGDGLGADAITANNLSKIQKAMTSEERIKSGQASYNDFYAQAMESASPEIILDAEAAQELVHDHYILRAFFPFLTKMPESLLGRIGAGTDHVLNKFTAGAGHATVRSALTINTVNVEGVKEYFNGVLKTVHYAFPDTKSIAPIYAKIQLGEEIVGDFSSSQRAAIEQLKMLNDTLFEGTERAPSTAGIFFRNGADIDHINAKLNQMKLPEHMRFDLDKAIVDAGPNPAPNVIREVLANQWKDWPVDDPIDFISKLQSAAITLHGDQSIAFMAGKILKDKNLMSLKRREGFVRLIDSKNKNTIIRYLPQNAWFHPDAANEILSMEKILSESLSLNSSFGKWLNKYIDPLLNMWKSGMTIYNPGFHPRNMVGDAALTFQAEGLGKISQPINAMKVMAIKDNYDGFSALRALMGLPLDAGKTLDEAKMARGASVVSHVTLKGGKKVELTAKEVNDYTRSNGLLMKFRVSEDLLIQDNALVSPEIRKMQQMAQIFHGKMRERVGTLSEAREDHVRLTHFLQVMDQDSGKYSNIEEAMMHAVLKSRKWHPDGANLTPFETKYMRRMFPFYSWTKKAVPLVAETMLMRPGRFMVFPKAMFNMAKASGIDLNSISDPFPTDQLFPSFLTSQMNGPLAKVGGSYFTANPGIPSVDLPSQFLGNPSESIPSMLNPMIKAPIELKTGTRLDTGSSIGTPTEYIGSSIPGLAQTNRLTGVDILKSLTGGQGIQDIKSVDKGNRGNLDPRTLVNYLSGLGITNMSTPSYIKYAQIEKRNAAKGASGG